MSDKELIFAFGRTGSKARLRNKIYNLMPKDFKTYVEPFVGGGSVYLGYKFKPGQRAVLNDKDKTLMGAWRILKNPPKNVNWRQYDTENLSKLQSLADSTSSSPAAKLVKQIVLSRNTFSGKGVGKIYRTINPYGKLKNIDDYEAKLKNATLLNKDVGAVISAYDNPNNFFYFDPPYEESPTQGKLYEHGDFDLERFAKRLKTMKAKFLLSLNDSPNVRKLFSGFKIRGFTQQAQNRSQEGPTANIGSKPRKEVLISNY